jgi:hypothetical protein
MRLSAGVLGLSMAAGGCGGPFGSAPLVLTEVPNRPSGQSLIAVAAERSGCKVGRSSSESMRITCPEGELDVPTFAGPPTFAVRCIDARLQDVAACTALVRKILLASEPPTPPSS